jgi:glyoxylate reductase
MDRLKTNVRSIVPGHNHVLAGRFKRFETMLMLGPDLSKSRLGIVGCGRIGQAVAKRARAFGMDVVYNDRRRLPDELENGLGIR